MRGSATRKFSVWCAGFVAFAIIGIAPVVDLNPRSVDPSSTTDAGQRSTSELGVAPVALAGSSDVAGAPAAPSSAGDDEDARLAPAAATESPVLLGSDATGAERESAGRPFAELDPAPGADTRGSGAADLTSRSSKGLVLADDFLATVDEINSTTGAADEAADTGETGDVPVGGDLLAAGRRVDAELAAPTTAPADTAAPSDTAAAPSSAAAAATVAPVVAAEPTAPPPTSAPEPTAAPALSTAQRRGQAALARLNFDWASLGYRIDFSSPRQGFLGLTFPYERRIEIYVSDSMTDQQLAHVVAHEIGHAIDVTRNNEADRRRWLTARGLPQTTAWWAGEAVADFASGSGDFAECFAWWQLGTPPKSRLVSSCQGTQALLAELSAG